VVVAKRNLSDLVCLVYSQKYLQGLLLVVKKGSEVLFFMYTVTTLVYNRNEAKRYREYTI